MVRFISHHYFKLLFRAFVKLGGDNSNNNVNNSNNNEIINN